MHCNVCQAPLGEPIYQAHSDQALSTMSELHSSRLRVWACGACGHLCGEPLPDTKGYYESDYRILLDHDDEDQIYEVQDGRITYRTDHQLSTLLDKLKLPAGTIFLDYGCAKGAMPKRLLAHHPELQVHLFDVTETYRAHWDRLVPSERQATHTTPEQWNGRFDVVTSFFALEHIPTPCATVAHVATLLKEGGTFYGIVPDTFGNPADFVVLDHVNHFTAESLHHLLSTHGFSQINIDASAHRGALVFTARKGQAATARPDLSAVLARAQKLAQYWDRLDECIHAAEDAAGDSPTAIYGSGFYGAYIASHLRHLDRVQCFLDRNPYQQGKTLFGKPILAPAELPSGVRALHVGLNPLIARAALAEQTWLSGRDVDLMFLAPSAA